MTVTVFRNIVCSCYEGRFKINKKMFNNINHALKQVKENIPNLNKIRSIKSWEE